MGERESRRWVLLIRAANAGVRNRVPMAGLRTLLGDLGHTDVRTALNSGNAVWTSDRSDPAEMAAEVEQGMRERMDVDLRTLVLGQEQVRRMHGQAPAHDGYRLVATLFAEPDPDTLAMLLSQDFGADTLVAGPRDAGGRWRGVPALHLAYAGPVHTSTLQTGRLERALGVAMTARTPDTLAKLLS